MHEYTVKEVMMKKVSYRLNQEAKIEEARLWNNICTINHLIMLHGYAQVAWLASWTTFPGTKAFLHTKHMRSYYCVYTHILLTMGSKIAAVSPANQHHDAPPEYVEASPLFPHQRSTPAAERWAWQALLLALRRRHVLRFHRPTGEQEGS